MIRPADPAEAAAISALAVRSKAHWGYTPEQMDVFRRELTLTPADVERSRAHVCEEDGCIVGFYTLGDDGEGDASLEHLFVDPAHLGHGVGTALLTHACAAAAATGRTRLVIQSDPNAAGFYRARGARPAGSVPSSIPGRALPVLVVDLQRGRPPGAPPR